MLSEADLYRTFIAIEIPRDVRRRIIEHIDRLQHEFPNVRASWNRADNFHITLKFLGKVPVRDIRKLCDAVERTTKTVPPFEITVAVCGTFPPRGRPRVLWLGLPHTPTELMKLSERLENECERAGFKRAERPFEPHLTIARIRDAIRGRLVAALHRKNAFERQTVAVQSIVVMRSELRSDGAKHSVISNHLLRYVSPR